MKYIVAPRQNHKYLLNDLRKDNPFLEVHLISKEDLLASFYPKASSGALLYLIKKYHFNYETAKLYLSDVLKVKEEINNEKIKFLLSIKDELDKEGLLVYKDNKEYIGQEAEVIGYDSSDFTLTNALKSLKMSFVFRKNEIVNKERTIVEFDKVEEETIYVLNEIASLLDSGVSIKDIFILSRNKVYNYYLKKYSSYFGYKLNIQDSDSLYLTGASKSFLLFYKENQNIEESLTLLKEEMKDDELYFDIEEVVLDNKIEGFDFNDQYDYFVNKLKETKINSPRYDKAVEVISSPILVNDKHIFIMGFAQGSFPLSSKDTGYLNNEELHLINRLNSKDKTKLDELAILDLINSNNHLYFSFAKRSIEGGYYPSPISKLIEFKEEKRELGSVFYSKDAAKLLFSNLKDLEHFYKERKDDYLKLNKSLLIEYNNYDNSFSNDVKVYDQNSFITLSTTSLQLYSSCPFAYYLSNILKIDEFESTFYTALGNLAHHLIERCREPDFDFENEFSKELANYEYKKIEKYIITHQMKEQIKNAINAIKLREAGYKNPTIFNEYEINKPITKKTYLKGRIDNIVCFDDKYVSCIDYKTGNTKFSDKYLKNGLYTQLPTYSYLLSLDEKFKDKEVIGLYLNNIINNSIKVEQKEGIAIPEYLKLNGKSIADVEKVNYIDSTFNQGLVSNFISGVKLKAKEPAFVSNSSLISKEQFLDYVLTVKDLYLKMDEDLRNNRFDISPYYISDEDNGCSYCAFKDICFMRRHQYRKLKEEESVDE